MSNSINELFNAMLIQEDVPTVGCIFPTANYVGDIPVYTYLVPPYLRDFKFEVGQQVIINARGKYKIAEVAEVHDECQVELNGIEYKYLVGVVDSAKHEEHLDSIQKFKKALRREEAKAAAMKYIDPAVVQKLPSRL